MVMDKSDEFWKNFLATKDLIYLPSRRNKLWCRLRSFFGFSAKKRLIFVCVHNSARSQIAEAWLNHLYGDSFHADSAGLKPGRLNPLAVQVMREVDIDILKNKTKGVFDLVKSSAFFDYVITVCDEASAEKCPAFSGKCTRLRWNFPDPSEFVGSPEEQLKQMRTLRDAIRERIEGWCFEVLQQGAKS